MSTEVPSTADLLALLQKIKELEQNNDTLTNEKKALLDDLTVQSGKVDQLQQKNKEELWGKLKTTIFPWVEEVLKGDEKRAKELQAGLGRLADKGEDSELISVMACASEMHIGNVTELERFRKENLELRTKLNGGQFAMQQDRMAPSDKVAGKRKKMDVIDVDAEKADAGENDGIWGEFKTVLKGSGSWC